MINDLRIVLVILNNPCSETFDYLIPKNIEVVQPGQLVLVPLGNQQHCVGIVYKLVNYTKIPFNKLKLIKKVYNLYPTLSTEWLNLIRFTASYYQYNLGKIALTVLPVKLRTPKYWAVFEKKNIDEKCIVTHKGKINLLKSISIRANAQKRLANALLNNQLTINSLLKLHPNAKSLLTQWQLAGWINFITETGQYASLSTNLNNKHEKTSSISFTKLLKNDENHLKFTSNLQELFVTKEQSKTIDYIISTKGFNTFLLYDFYGSNKIEIYLYLIYLNLKYDANAQILILIPEINLAISQFITRLYKYFTMLNKQEIVLINSNLTEKERVNNWLAVHQGIARIVIGTRVAALSSFSKLVLIIVDEEHEYIYKEQQNQLQYSARNLCIWRAKQLNIPIVLGSSTPSLESWSRAQNKYYHLITLKKLSTPNKFIFPTIQIIDINLQKNINSFSNGLSKVLLNAIRTCLKRGEQSLLLLNRRGYAPILICKKCKKILTCKYCSAYLVLHFSDKNILKCHYCHWQKSFSTICPFCSNTSIFPIGEGTQRIELAITQNIPEAKILRIDSDNINNIDTKLVFSQNNKNNVDILISTYLLVKHYFFHNLTLIGIIDSDMLLFSQNFRASEKLFNQLLQIVIKAGHLGKQSKIFIQTYYPKHPLYISVAKYDYINYTKLLLNERYDACLPPFIYQALLKARATLLNKVLEFLENASKFLDELYFIKNKTVIYYPPLPLKIVKINNLHRAQILLESKSRYALHTVLKSWNNNANKNSFNNIQWLIIVDPLEI